MSMEQYTPRAAVTTVYKVPEKLASKTGISTITMRELTVDDELMATQRCNNDPMKLQWHLALQAIFAIDGRELSLVDGSADRFWNTAPSKIRQLIMRAYGDIHNPDKDDADLFLKSRQTEVG